METTPDSRISGVFHDVADIIGHRLLGRELNCVEQKHVHELLQSLVRTSRGEMKSTTNGQPSERLYWTPPELAREWGVSPDKILNWIRSGELPAIDVASKAATRPRYRIDAEGIAKFKARRSVYTPPPAHRRRQRKSDDVIKFF